MYLKKKSFVGFFFILSLFFMFLPVFSVIVETLIVPINGENELQINLGQGESVEGSISISGTDYISLFEIKDSKEQRLEIFGRVDDDTSFEFTAKNSGDYILFFKNFSDQDSEITISYEIESGPFSLLFKNPYQTIGLIMIVGSLLVGAITLYFINRKRSFEWDFNC